jgi:pilus assembly protein CpaE
MDYQGTVRVVLNRADTKVGISPEDVTAIMGRRPDILVPSDRNVTRAVNQGEPIVSLQRKSDASRSYQALAALYVDAHTRLETANGRRRRRLGLRRRER